ncbi:hypothetical protein NHX12_024257 [Muraenolepis orangiensis]|uniref:Pericentrin/AKAP-450 centrosomal targeting domain-containing protein n=1 Tax=Muraenolepis orangiensis TaxID=630683 RepID=A0A9Q0IUM9_9TELE|nr:hypothetical protein NHX12_024257 [Muraenolepis orangiensis]
MDSYRSYWNSSAQNSVVWVDGEDQDVYEVESRVPLPRPFPLTSVLTEKNAVVVQTQISHISRRGHGHLLKLEHARVTQTELMRESFRHNQEMGELLQRQEELQEQLAEEGRAREQLALELHRAEGVIDGYSDERVTASRLNELEQERLLMHQEKELLGRQQDAMREQAGPRELRLVEAAVVSAPEAAAGGEGQLGPGQLEEQVNRSIELERDQRAEGQDLRQQIQALEKQLENNRKFLAEQAVDREHERDVFQQEIQTLEEQLKNPQKLQGASDPRSKEVERLSSQLQQKADRCSDLLLGSEQQQRELDHRDQEIDKLEARIRELEQALLASAESLEKEEERKQHDSATEARQHSLEAQLQTEREALDRKEKEITHLEEQLEQFREELENKGEEAQQLSMQLEVQGRELGSQQQHLETRESMLQVMEEKDRQILALNEKLAKLQRAETPGPDAKDLDHQEELIRDLESQVECLRSEQERLKRNGEEELEQLNAVIDKLQQELANIEQKLPLHDDEEAEDEVEGLKEHSEAQDGWGENKRSEARLEDALRETTAGLVVVQAQVRALERSAASRVEELRSHVEELESTAGEKDKELARCRLLVERAQSEMETLQGEVHRLEDRLRETVASALVSQAQLGALQQPQEHKDHRQTKEGETKPPSMRSDAPLADDFGDFALPRLDFSSRGLGGARGPAVGPGKVGHLTEKLRELEVGLSGMQKDQELQKQLLSSSEEEVLEYERRLAVLMDLLTQMKSRSGAQHRSWTPTSEPSPAAKKSAASELHQELKETKENKTKPPSMRSDAPLADDFGVFGLPRLDFSSRVMGGARGPAVGPGKVGHLTEKLRELEVGLSGMQKDQELQKQLLSSSEEEVLEYERRLAVLMDLLTQMKSRAGAQHRSWTPTSEPSPAAEQAAVSEVPQEMQDVRSETKATKEQLDRYQQSSSRLEGQLVDYKQRCSQLQEELDNYKQSSGRLEQQQDEDSQQRPGQLQQELENYKQSSSQLQEQLDQYKESSSQLEEQLADYKQSCSKLQEQLDDSKQSCSKLQEQLDDSKQSSSKLQEQLDDSKQSSSKLQEQLDDSKQSSSKLQEQLDDSKQSSSKLQEQLDDSKQSSSKLQEQLDDSKQSCSKLQEQLDDSKQSSSKEKTLVIDRLEEQLQKQASAGVCEVQAQQLLGPQPELQEVQGAQPELQEVQGAQPELQEVQGAQPELQEVQGPQPELQEVQVSSKESSDKLQELLQVTAGAAEEGVEGSGVPKLHQQLRELRSKAATAEEEFASCRKRADKLQEELRCRDLAVAQLKDQLRDLHSKRKAGKSLSNKGSGNAKEKASLSRKNSAAGQQSSVKTQSSGGPRQEQPPRVSVAHSSTQTQQDLPTDTAETVTLSSEKIVQMQELHAAEILDMEARHISESEGLRFDTQALENECKALKAVIDQLRSAEAATARTDRPASLQFRDGYASDSSSDYSQRTGYDPPSLLQEFRSTPDGARREMEDPLPDKIKTLLREVHQEGMQVLSLSEFPLTEDQAGGPAGDQTPGLGWPRERQALLDSVQSLKTLVTQMQTLRETQRVLTGERGVLKSALYGTLDLLDTSDAILHLNRLEQRLEQQEVLHREAMGSLHASERSSLLSEVQQLRAQMELLHPGGQPALPPGAEAPAAPGEARRERPGPGHGEPGDRVLLEEVKGELAQTQLELETTLKAQHKHLKELDTLRTEVSERADLRVAVEEQRSHVAQLTSTLEEERRSSLSLQTRLQELQVQLDTQRATAREMSSALGRERQLRTGGASLLQRLQRDLDEKHAQVLRLLGELETQRLEAVRQCEEVSLGLQLTQRDQETLGEARGRVTQLEERILGKLHLTASKIRAMAAKSTDRRTAEVEQGELSWIQTNLDQVISMLQQPPGLPLASEGLAPMTGSEVGGGSSNFLSERLLRQNAELTGFVSRLTEEKSDLRNQTLRLEEELRRQRRTGLQPALTEQEAWSRERGRLERALQQSQAQTARLKGEVRTEALRDVTGPEADNATLKRMYGRYLRSESFRKALVYQKKYLLLLLGGFQECEEATLALICRMGGRPAICSPDAAALRHRGLSRFRSAVRVSIALSRMRFLVRRWQKATGVGTSSPGPGLGKTHAIGMEVKDFLHPGSMEVYRERGGGGGGSSSSSRGRSGRESPRSAMSATPHRFHVGGDPGSLTCSHLLTYDPDRALTDYISRLEALQRRLGSVTSGSTSYAPLHFGLRR